MKTKEMDIYEIARHFVIDFNSIEFKVKQKNGHIYIYQYPLHTLAPDTDYHIVKFPVNRPEKATTKYHKYTDKFNVIV